MKTKKNLSESLECHVRIILLNNNENTFLSALKDLNLLNSNYSVGI